MKVDINNDRAWPWNIWSAAASTASPLPLPSPPPPPLPLPLPGLLVGFFALACFHD